MQLTGEKEAGRGKTREKGSKMAGEKESWASRSQRKRVERQEAGNTEVQEGEAREEGYGWGGVTGKAKRQVWPWIGSEVGVEMSLEETMPGN